VCRELFACCTGIRSTRIRRAPRATLGTRSRSGTRFGPPDTPRVCRRSRTFASPTRPRIRRSIIRRVRPTFRGSRSEGRSSIPRTDIPSACRTRRGTKRAERRSGVPTRSTLQHPHPQFVGHCRRHCPWYHRQCRPQYHAKNAHPQYRSSVRHAEARARNIVPERAIWRACHSVQG